MTQYPAYSHLTVDNRQLEALNGVRGIAALFIAIFHGNYWPPVFISAYIMVDLFFMLSGFIIARTYLEGIATGRISLRQFVVRRFSRLYPMHVFTLFLVLLMFTCGLGTPWLTPDPNPIYSFGLNLLFLQNVGWLPRLGWNIASWSLSVEWIVNLCFFALALRAKTIPVALLALVVFMSVSIINMTSPTHGLHLTFQNFYFLNYGLLRGIAGFSIGLLIYRYHLLLPRLRSVLWHGVELAVVLAIGTYAVWPIDPELHDIDYLMLLFFFPLLIVICLYKAAFVQRLFSTSPFRLFGELSYCIYMINYPMYLLFNQWVEKNFASSLMPVWYLTAVILFSAFCHIALEKPARAYINRRFA